MPKIPGVIPSAAAGMPYNSESLKTHINYVFKIQNRTYWTARRYANRWQALQAQILAQYINIYRAQVATKPPLLPASISMRLVGKLLGEELKLSSTRIRKNSTVLCVKTALATANIYGVHVPVPGLGLSKWIPGLLFAYDVVVLAESSDKLQIALGVITRWSDIYKMTVNAGKCGIIPINIADLIRFPLKSRSSTWVSGTLKWQKRYNHSIGQGATRISIDARNLLYPELKLGLNMICKISTGTYWSTERLAKSQLIPKLYEEKCPCCNVNVPEIIKHILLGCGRWAAIRAETIDKFLPQLYKLAINNNNQLLMEAKMQLLSKLLEGGKKESNMPLSMELETAKFMDGIHVARTLILDGIKCSPTPLNQCPVRMESLEGRKGVV
ncbi:hypothetical protein BB561_000282 [Smittium simulii]|uniref:Uncharacterized protein n=1 Tax=Smittium simulii TaxID=133385 RepID=A0A2T9YZU9_9FUNG|nr:hypothetical protein BB561_000282 [Smittium simulii]